MAMNYFARVASRANSAGPTQTSVAARPAKAIDSPLVDVDQRLNLDPGEDFAAVPPTAQAPASPDAPSVSDTQEAGEIGAMPEAPLNTEVPEETLAPNTLAPDPQSEPLDDPPVSDPPDLSPDDDVQFVEHRAPPSVVANENTAEIFDTPNAEPPAPRPPTKEHEKDRRPDGPQSTPLARMMKAVAAAERWVTEDPAQSETVERREIEREAVAPRDQNDTIEVTPILPETMSDRPQQPVPRGPTVEIGQIEIEVVPRQHLHNPARHRHAPPRPRHRNRRCPSVGGKDR
ncbi:hypothetical protein ACERZ8_09520 [Tateyamaria armeniaca]|uniref:Uncharacterized protein n=1 Tax=Tateyamaria armeniaca TaxID=2518930 RepID=A0ABW8USJ4_9RHOB